MTRSPVIPATLLCLALLGCVSKGSYELVEVQLDATRAAMNARQAAAQDRIRELEAEIARHRDHQRTWQAILAERDQTLHTLQEQLGRDREADAAHFLAEICLDEEEHEDEDEGDREEVPPDPICRETATGLGLVLADADRRAREARRLEAHHDEVQRALAELVKAGRLEVLRDGEDAIVRIPVHVLFQEGRVLVSPLGESVLEQIAEGLRSLAGRTVRVEGHTDTKAHHSVQYASNWELGFGRAITVLRWLEDHEVRLPLSAGSWAGLRPLRDAGDPDARRANQRVELRIALDPALDLPLLPLDDDDDSDDDAPEGVEAPASTTPAAEG